MLVAANRAVYGIIAKRAACHGLVDNNVKRGCARAVDFGYRVAGDFDGVGERSRFAVYCSVDFVLAVRDSEREFPVLVCEAVVFERAVGVYDFNSRAGCFRARNNARDRALEACRPSLKRNEGVVGEHACGAYVDKSCGNRAAERVVLYERVALRIGRLQRAVYIQLEHRAVVVGFQRNAVGGVNLVVVLH